MIPSQVSGSILQGADTTAQDKQPRAIFSDFLRVSVMVPDLSEARRVYAFIEGFLEPLCGLVKSHIPSTLQEVVVCAKYLQGASPRQEPHSLH